MTDDLTPAPVVDPEPSPSPAVPPPGRGPSSAGIAPRRPAYKGEELDAARGPGLGCFWFQVAVLAFFLVLIPIGVTLAWPYELLAALLFVVLGLLLFVGQTLIFLLRIVAADRRDAGRRRPLASATPTVGELEDGLAGAASAVDEPTPAGGTEPEPGETAGDVVAPGGATPAEPGEMPTAEPGEMPTAEPGEMPTAEPGAATVVEEPAAAPPGKPESDGVRE